MRLIGTLPGQKKPERFSRYLKSQGIENEYELMESAFQEPPTFRIWIHDEDQVEKAKQLFEEFQRNPEAPQFQAQTSADPIKQSSKGKKPSSQSQKRFLSPSPYGPISILIILTVILIFVWSQAQRTTVMPPEIKGIIRAPILSPIEKVMLFDYPAYFQLRDKLFKVYTPQEIEEKKPPSQEARQLIQQIRNTPVWMGIYDRIVAYARDDRFLLAYQGPMFEKIGQGEMWRLFTPCLLHFNLLHIFFNLLWFILLGNQIEHRIGAFRYILIILVTGILSNTAQYLMSGPFFMGLSGVICALAGFIWARQQTAPWEGYLLQRFTLIFLGIFILGMFFLQLAFFFMQIFGHLDLAPIRIANTAHLVGAAAGYVLGRMRFFSISAKKTR